MKNFFIILSIFGLIVLQGSIAASLSYASGNEHTIDEEFSDDDMEIIIMMDLLENMDYLEDEDVALLQSYDLLETIDNTGEQNDK